MWFGQPWSGNQENAGILSIVMPHLLLYDGLCGLCNRTVQSILKRDPVGRFRFAALQSELGRRWLADLGRSSESFDSIVLIVDEGSPSQRVLTRSVAAMFIAGQAGGWWRILGLFRFLPPKVLDYFYNLIARKRYRWFGRYDSCPLPEEPFRDRFLD